MKKVLLAVMVMVGTVALAQKNHGDHKRGLTNSADRMKQDLSLSDDQYTKVKGINEKYASSYSAVRQDTSLTRGRAASKLNKLKTDREAELKKVLSAEQWTKWTSNDRNGRHGLSADRMKQKLSLSDDQYNKVKAINEKYSSKYSSVQTEQEAELKKVLTPEQWATWTDLKAKKTDDHKGHHRGGHYRGRRHHG
jgi:Spy/CpxP family protein refolding chaperone